MRSPRQRTRRMFRRLSWTIGILFAVISGLMVMWVMVVSPELTSVADGEFLRVALLLVAVAMGFGVGFMLLRVTGWVVLSMMPHSRQHSASSDRDDDYDDDYEDDDYDDDIYEYDDDIHEDDDIVYEDDDQLIDVRGTHARAVQREDLQLASETMHIDGLNGDQQLEQVQQMDQQGLLQESDTGGPDIPSNSEHDQSVPKPKDDEVETKAVENKVPAQESGSLKLK